MWQVRKIERWIVINPENGAAIVEDRGSKAKQFNSEHAAQIAADEMKKYKGD